jgi:hypothetical protein
MGKNLTGFYVGVYEDRDFGARTIPDEVEDLQKSIDCRCFDITRRKIGGTYYDIVCDDEGLFREAPVPSAVNSDGEVMLVGNLFICRHKGSNLASLTDKDMARIAENLRIIVTRAGVTPVIVCEY